MLKNLIFLPSLMADSRMYQPQIDALAYLPIQTHVFINDRYHSIQDFATHILQKVAGDIVVVGTSMGGYVAMEMFKQNSARVKNLCLLNTTYNKDSSQKKAERLSIIHELKQIKDSEFVGINNKIIADYIVNITPEKEFLIKDMVKSMGRNTFIIQQQMILSRPSYKVNFINYPQNTLFIGAEKDTLTPPNIIQEMAYISNSTCIILKNCGHLSPIDQPTEVASLIKDWVIKNGN